MILLYDYIIKQLNCNLYENAIFYAELLYSLGKTNENALLLAKAHFQARNYSEILILYQNHSTLEIAYLAARACKELGRYTEGISVLNGSSQYCADQKLPLQHLFLLAQLYETVGNIAEAIHCYKRCLELDPFMITAYEALCNLSATQDDVAPFLSATNTPPDAIVYDGTLDSLLQPLQSIGRATNMLATFVKYYRLFLNLFFSLFL